MRRPNREGHQNERRLNKDYFYFIIYNRNFFEITHESIKLFDIKKSCFYIKKDSQLHKMFGFQHQP